jgi:hypothetical protein
MLPQHGVIHFNSTDSGKMKRSTCWQNHIDVLFLDDGERESVYSKMTEVCTLTPSGISFLFLTGTLGDVQGSWARSPALFVLFFEEMLQSHAAKSNFPRQSV